MTVTVTVTGTVIVIVTVTEIVVTASYFVTNKRPGHQPRRIQHRSLEKCHHLPWHHLPLHLVQFLTEAASLATFPTSRLSSSRTVSDQHHLAI